MKVGGHIGRPNRPLRTGESYKVILTRYNLRASQNFQLEIINSRPEHHLGGDATASQMFPSVSCGLELDSVSD
jgi:hypothetical protein